MSKKAGKKAKVKVPEIDPDSPEWIEEVARKQSEAYDLVQRAMIRSQIDVELTTRDDLVKQKAELETKARQQSQDQSDIYQYLRNKLKDNYVAIAELENKVSHAHDERLTREKQLLTTIKNLDQERESETRRLEERLASLDVELTAIKEYQENSEVYEQTLKDMEAQITDCKDTFNVEVSLLNTQLEEEWETGRRDKEERRKITKKAAAKATQEQLGPRTKHRIAQNKKMMSELRFQCFEVEKMHRARQGLMKSNTLLLAQAASARYRVEDLARRSHLLQRIIRYMNQKLRSRSASVGDLYTGQKSGDGSGGQDVRPGHEQRGWSAGAVGNTRGAGDRSEGRGGVGESGALYKLAGMSEEERQQMLDLREELRAEEVSIAAAQAVAGKLREQVLRINGERFRSLQLKTDLARTLALCHEDPLLGTDDRRAPRTTSGLHRRFEDFQPRLQVGPSSCTSPFLPTVEGCTLSGSSQMLGELASCASGVEEGFVESLRDRGPVSVPEDAFGTATLPRVDNDGLSIQAQRREQKKDSQNQQRQHQEQHQQVVQGQDHAPLKVASIGGTADRGVSSAEGRSPSAVDVDQCLPSADVRGLPLWPESVVLPSPTFDEVDTGEVGGPEGGEDRCVKDAARYMSADVLRGVARLFLSKLQVSVEAVTPRPLVTETETYGFPSLASGTSLDGGGSAFGVSTDARQLRVSRRGTRSRANSRRAKRKGVGGSSTAGANDGDVGQHLRRGRGGASSRGVGGGDDGGDHSTSSGVCHTEEEFWGARHGHERGTSKRGEPDDATSSWSSWHPTGIPSWDILESAVRRTKRQRTRDAACQTLTYRQLRDGENTVVPKRNHPVRCKHANNTAQPTPEEPQKARARQGHEHQETRFHVVPASRFVSMLNPPSCSMSSTTTLSTASVYRVTDGGGVVHGAIVRGGTRSTDVEERRRVPRQRQDRVAGRGGGNGDVNDNVVRAKHLESRLTHALGVPASTRRQQGRRVDGPKFNLSADDEAGTGLFASLANGEGMVICTPALSSQQHNIPLQDHHQLPQQGLSAPAQSPIQQPGAIGDRSMSPTLGQVAISWGREAGNETAGKMQGNEPSMGGDSAAAVPSFSRGGRGPRPLRSDRDTLEAGCYDMSSNGGAGQDGGTGSEGFAYESLSKGPDYRKVLLFTVDDADCRILRRSHASPTRPGKGKTANTDGAASRRDTVRTANGRRRSDRSPSRQRGRVAAGTKIIRSLSSPAAPKAVEARLAEATAADLSGTSSVGLGLLISRSGKGGKDRSTEGAGGKGSGCVGKNGSVMWERDGGMEGLDGGRTFCSSVSTLSGEAF